MVGNKAWQNSCKDWIEKEYPCLKDYGYEITSPDTIDYNCVAWAAEENDCWWWPKPDEQDYWPENVPREETVEAFIKAFETLGYQTCNIPDLETDFQKVAIYTKDGKPTHMARQLDNGNWTSKLGSSEDIKHHTLEGLECKNYGTATIFMKRPIQNF